MTAQDAHSSEDDAQDLDTGDTGKGLRGQLEAALSENRKYKAKERDGILTGIGLDPATGMGKMMVEKFDAGGVSLESLAATAINEYGWVPPEAPVDTNPQAQQIQQGQAQLDAVSEQAGSLIPPTKQTELQEAEESGDYSKAMAIKSEQMRDWFKAPPR